MGPVLLVAPQPFYEDRGTPIAVRQVLEALSELGYEVDVVTYPVGAEVEIERVRVHRAANPFGYTHVPIGLSARKLVLDVALLPVIARRLRARRYACIHAVEEAAFPAMVLGRRYGVPVIYDMQSSLPEQLSKHALFRARPVQRVLDACERWLLRRADLVVSSAGLAARVAAAAPLVPVREWAYAGSSAAPPDAVAARAELGVPDGVPVVMYTGTFEAYQGLPELIGAIPLVRQAVHDATFVLVGADAAGGDAVQRQARAAGLNGALRIVARQPRERIAELLAAADVVVSPRAGGNNLPLKIFDYLMAGKPIVATDIPTHRSVLDEERAVLVDPTAAGLAAGIVGVLRDPERAACLADAARSYGAAHSGRAGFVAAIGEMYAEVCGGARR